MYIMKAHVIAIAESHTQPHEQLSSPWENGTCSSAVGRVNQKQPLIRMMRAATVEDREVVQLGNMQEDKLSRLTFIILIYDNIF